MPLTIRRTPRTAQGFIEPMLSIAEALPLHMVLIPAGTFLMGHRDESGRYRDDGPEHEVTLPSFFMGRYPITQAQWRAVAALPQINEFLDPELSPFEGDNHPAVQLSWHEATEFCSRLAAYTGRPYRLPSEAEWEYACRAGTTTPFCFGNTLTDQLANYDASHPADNNGSPGKNRQGTTPVDHFGIANHFGLSDMHGNVFEWCADTWHETYESAPTDGRAWTKGGALSRRIQRGGGWGLEQNYALSGRRSHDAPESRDVNFGLRVVCSLSGAQSTDADRSQAPIRIFVSYAAADEALKNLLCEQLESLTEQSVIITIDSQRVVPGMNWTGQLRDSLEQADIILMLISSNYLASQLCRAEMMTAVNRHNERLSRAIPVILRPTNWENYLQFNEFNSLPRNGRPITDSENIEKALNDVCRFIQSNIELVRSERDPNIMS